MLFSLLALHLFALATPGPDFTFVATTALKGNQKESLYAAAGIAIGVLVWVVLSLTGLHLLFVQYPMSQTFLSCLGAGYLYYLSWVIYQDARHPFVPNSSNGSNGSNGNILLKGLLTNLSNPKAMIYFASIFSSFEFVSEGNTLASALLLMTVITLESFLWFFCVGKLFSLTRSRQIYMRRKRHIDSISSAAFFLFASLMLLRLLF